MKIQQVIRGPILNPRDDGGVDFIVDGALVGDERGLITFVGAWDQWSASAGARAAPRARQSDGFVLPPFLDAHIHIPQHPIRGRFLEGLDDVPSEGRLLWGLKQNVFPAEARCEDAEYTRRVVETFRADTLAKGVVGGAAYMTVHPAATRIALETLPDTWQVGLVLMNQQCPDYLRTDETSLENDIRTLARDFGRRLIVTDRFAVAVDSPLRRQAVTLARDLGLRMQTHLNEQIAEKRFVEQTLYPDAGSYTDVYSKDGLLDRDPILAHCVRMSDAEFDTIAAAGASIAHCPVSNTLLGSGIMPLDAVLARRIRFALCTDVGASPTTSLLTEMVQFLRVHAGRSSAATPELALYLATRAPARILGLEMQLGTFGVGRPMSFIEVVSESPEWNGVRNARSAILDGLLGAQGDVSQCVDDEDRSNALDRLQREGLNVGPALAQLDRDVAETADRLNDVVRRVTLQGKVVWESV